MDFLNDFNKKKKLLKIGFATNLAEYFDWKVWIFFGSINLFFNHSNIEI